jgi:glyoxylase-like metal-dependent hydrolase (beta-lactamase superfamily II)
MKLRTLVCLALLAPAGALADSAVTKERTVHKIVDGVYMIRHPDAPDTFPQSNTTVVIGSKAVLVVDSCYMPSDAKKDIAQIRQWTKLPVKYLVNTHWHFDHTMGNGVYAAEFPGISIIAHRETRNHMIGYNPGWFERYPKRTVELRAQLDSGKDAEGKPLAADLKAELAKVVPKRALVEREFKALVDRVPDVGFDDELDLDLGGREVQLKFLGRGNTSGDIVLWLPKEKVLAAGDLVDHPVPYLGSGYPREQIETLKRLTQLDFTTLVPGHGELLPGDRARAFIALESEFISEMRAKVSAEIYRIGGGFRNIDKVREGVMKSIDVAGWRKKFIGDDEDSKDYFDTFSLPGAFNGSFAELFGR